MANAAGQYTVVAHGFRDDLVRYEGFTVLDRELGLDEAFSSAERYVAELAAEGSATGAVTIRRNREVVVQATPRDGAWSYS